MKVLLSCVNSLVSLVGFDTDTRTTFWYAPADRVRACGACYDGNALLIVSDNFLTRIEPGGVSQTRLPGPHDNLAHSVRLAGARIGIADTGNSRLLLAGRGNEPAVVLDPLAGWGDRPADAIHLNDFLPWGDGVLASCFDYQPYGHAKGNVSDWSARGLGLILSMERSGSTTVSRVAAAGLNCPHSLVRHGDAVYCCSSSQGDFYRFTPTEHGLLYETARWHVTDDHFLRGALHDGSGWLLGGSSVRRQTGQSPMSLYRFDEATGRAECMKVAGAGEIYDILPWDDAVMRPLAGVINAIPPADRDDGNDYPDTVDLPAF